MADGDTTLKWWDATVSKAKDGGDGEDLDLFILDDIGGGTTAKQFIEDVQDLAEGKREIRLHINSPGGSVFEGLAIYNFLRSLSARVTTIVEGVAASIAAVIAMAGDRVMIPENGFLMIHNPISIAMGEADDMRQVADFLEKITGTIAGIFAKKTGLEEKEIRKLMAETTWMDGKEAVEKGFATDLTDAVKIAASFDLNKLENMPAQVADALAKQKGNAMEIEALQAENTELKSQLESSVTDGEAKAKTSFDEGVGQGEEQALGRVKARVDRYKDASFVLETIDLDEGAVKDAWIVKLEADNKAKSDAIEKLQMVEPDPGPVASGGSGNDPQNGAGDDAQAALKARVEELKKEGKGAEEAWKQARSELLSD